MRGISCHGANAMPNWGFVRACYYPFDFPPTVSSRRLLSWLLGCLIEVQSCIEGWLMASEIPVVRFFVACRAEEIHAAGPDPRHRPLDRRAVPVHPPGDGPVRPAHEWPGRT